MPKFNINVTSNVEAMMEIEAETREIAETAARHFLESAAEVAHQAIYTDDAGKPAPVMVEDDDGRELGVAVIDLYDCGATVDDLTETV